MSRSSATLIYPPTGAKVRCTANKKYALALPVFEREQKLKVLFRTNDADAMRKRGSLEARKRSRPMLVFRLTDGLFIGRYLPDGSATAASL